MSESIVLRAVPAWWGSIRRALLWCSFLVNPSRRRANVLYELVSTANYLTERTLFRNVGYWKARPATLDAACEALAHFAAEAAQLGPNDRVLDAGFGFGDQDMYWAEHFRPREVVGLNVTRSQVEVAQRRVAERGMSERIALVCASATKIPYPDGSFDKVIALESAFHFPTREDFFREAFRVLRPGGRIVTLDIVLQPDQRPSWRGRVLGAIGFHFWQICAQNLHDRAQYEHKLRATGFDHVDVSSVYEDTMLAFARYSLEELDKPEVIRRVDSRVGALIWLSSKSILDNPWGTAKLDYILAIAEKPTAIVPLAA